MSDLRRQREALGRRLTDLRTAQGVTVRALAADLGWPHSKVSKIGTGRQTPTHDDVTAWCTALGRAEAVDGILDQLATLEALYRTWRDQMKRGARAVQEAVGDLETRADTLRIVETAVVPGLLQTPDYARAMLAEAIDFFGATDDLDDAVAQRMARQAILYDTSRRFHIVIAEASLWHRVASIDVMAAQVQCLMPLTASRNVRLGIVPLTGAWKLSPAHPFWLYDDELVVVETLDAELRLTQAEEIATYARAFDAYAASAVYGPAARHLLTGLLDALANIE